jgi:hypothetical protein
MSLFTHSGTSKHTQTLPHITTSLTTSRLICLRVVTYGKSTATLAPVTLIPTPTTPVPATVSLPVHEAHGVDNIDGENQLGTVEACPLLWQVVVAHKVDEVTARHVVHHHVQVLVVLK